MKTAFTICFGLLLSVCLTLYGPVGMAQANGGAVFSMEICADGVAKTVLFDADGNPVEPAANCPECLTCCQVIGSHVSENCMATPSSITVEMVLEQLSALNTTPIKRHTFPAPRGPPAKQISILTKTVLIFADQPVLGEIMRRDGRLLFRDAIA
ncbi:MAG: hypothetical protein V7661_01285 [Sulfitobacter sp.]|jgi:hypothetical protein